jgi:hypothetical protein
MRSNLFLANPRYYCVRMIWFLIKDWNKNCLTKIKRSNGVLSSPFNSSTLINGLSKKLALIALISLIERTLFARLEKYPVIFSFIFKTKFLCVSQTVSVMEFRFGMGSFYPSSSNITNKTLFNDRGMVLSSID